MTDHEILRAMLQRAGIVFEDNVIEKDGPPYRADRRGDLQIIIRVDSSQPVYLGYSEFYSEMLFNPDGSLKAVGAWE